MCTYFDWDNFICFGKLFFPPPAVIVVVVLLGHPARNCITVCATIEVIMTMETAILTGCVCVFPQAILNEEVLALKYLDVMTILLKYCGPKAADKGETQAVIIDLIGTLGFFCVNNKRNQDLLVSPEKLVILKSVMKLPSQFQVAIYPTLVTVVWNNDAARQCIATEFDVEVSAAEII